MVLQGNVAGNPAGHWCPAPWDQDSAEWKKIDAQLPSAHKARQIEALVALLDLSPLFATYAGLGSCAQRPDLMLKVVLYEMSQGRLSPAQWSRDAWESLPVQWLALGICPGRSRWYDFLQRLAGVMDELNRQLLTLGIRWRLTTGTRAALDGSLVAADASRHGLLTDAGSATALEIAVFAAAGVELYAPFRESTPTAGTGKTAKQFPQSAFTWPPEEQVYICPAGQRLTAWKRARKLQSGGRTLEVIQYHCDPAQCRACELQGQCTQNTKQGRTVKRGEHDDLIDQLRVRMATGEAPWLYRLRKQTIELRYADVKQHRKLRRFNGRGLRRARTQLGLLVLCHNGRTLVQAQSTSTNPAPSDVTAEEVAA